MNRPEPKALEFKVPKGSNSKAKIYSRPKKFKPKFLNSLKPRFQKENVQNKRKPSRTNPKGPIKLWAPKSEIVIVTNMFKGKSKAKTLALGQWLIIIYYKRKAYVLNLNSKGGMNYEVWRKPDRKDHWHGYL